jgi:hypothetical protein
LPTEIRHIFFQPAEISAAVQALRERSGRKLPPGHVIDCSVEGGENGHDIRLTLSVQPDEVDSQPVQVAIAEGEIAASLILLCRNLKIPVPMMASKTIEVVGGRLGLICTKHPVDYEDVAF